MRPFIALIFLFSTQVALAQQTQISFQAGSGLFSFGGESATRTSFINLGGTPSISSYTNNPYGESSGFSYSFGVQLQKFAPGNFIYGLQLSYESLASRLSIDYASGDIPWVVREGETILRSNFINLFPSIGQRVNLIKGIDSDFLLGADLALGLSGKEKYNFTTTEGDESSGSNSRDIPNLDFRPRIEFVNYYKNVGLSIGYSYGVRNFQDGLDGANREVYSRYLRLALNFRLM